MTHNSTYIEQISLECLSNIVLHQKRLRSVNRPLPTCSLPGPYKLPAYEQNRSSVSTSRPRRLSHQIIPSSFKHSSELRKSMGEPGHRPWLQRRLLISSQILPKLLIFQTRCQTYLVIFTHYIHEHAEI